MSMSMVKRDLSVAVAAVCVLGLLGMGVAAGEIQYTEVNAAIPFPSGGNPDGLYLDLDTGTTDALPFDGYDFLFYDVLGSSVTCRSSLEVNNMLVCSGIWVEPLTEGTLIGPGSAFGSGQILSAYATPPFLVNALNYVGFSHPTPGGDTVYGWYGVDVGDTMADVTVTGFALESSGGSIAAGAVPEPGAAALLIFGLLAATRRRW